MSELNLGKAWQEDVHAKYFDGRARYSLQDLRGLYESYNETQLFLENKQSIQGHDFVEIGCATGELYRYLRWCHPEFSYRGFDISRPAIERARQKYPDGQFELCQPDLSDILKQN